MRPRWLPLSCVALTLVAAARAPARAAPTVKAIDPAPYLRQLALIGGDLRDVQATVDARMSEKESGRPVTFRVDVWFRTPDSVRMDVLSSSNGMFRGWKFARVGPKVDVYDPISERSTSLDFNRVTGLNPVRMDLGIDMSAGIFRPRNFRVTGVTATKLDGHPAVLMRFVPTAALDDPRSLVRLSYILVWMDPVRKVPLQQISFGAVARPPGARRPPARAGQRLFTARFSAFKPAGPGLWYPSRVDVQPPRGPNPGRVVPDEVHLTLGRIDGTLFPLELTTSGGSISKYVRYSHVRINTHFPDSTFRISE